MTDNKETLTINVNVELPPEAVSTVVQTAKKIVGTNAKGHYNVDTHEVLSSLISRFLMEKDFGAFARDVANYK